MLIHRIALLLGTVSVLAQGQAFKTLHIDRKPGETLGRAVITDPKGKLRVVASHTFQSLTVDNGENALVLTKTPKGGEGEAHLLYIEGSTNKHRDLGFLPFRSASVTEIQSGGGNTAYVVNGTSAGKPAFVVADMLGIRGRAFGVLSGKPSRDNIAYRNARIGRNVAAPLDAYLASDLGGIYRAPGSAVQGGTYLQFLPDGTLIIEEQDGSIRRGKWSTDGDLMNGRLPDGQTVEWHRSDLVRQPGVPASIRLRVRLLGALTSTKAKKGDLIPCVLMSPAIVDGQIYLPQGSRINGFLTEAHGVGFGLRHETAALTVAFNEAILPDGSHLALHARLYVVDNAQEKINDQGKVQGIRSTGTLGHSAEGKIASIANFDPVGYLFTTASATAALGFAEPEILYSSGTELVIEFDAPLITQRTFPSNTHPIASSPEEAEELARFVRGLSFRTKTKSGNKDSDLTNLVFLGPQEGIRRAFSAAGWVPADQLTARTTFQTVRTLAGNEVYREAPMSVLTLDERPPVFTLTKTTNTFSSRHHLRVFDPFQKFEGTTVYTSSSTQDIGIGFSRTHKTFIHLIDQYIDNERTKIVNDLEFTGCVTGAQLVERPWVPKEAFNSTGDRLRTDGAIAVIRITDCPDPHTVVHDNAVPPNRTQRIFRDTILTLRNDISRGNIPYQAVSSSVQARRYWTHRNDLKTDSGNWVKADFAGVSYKGVSNRASSQPSVSSVSATETNTAETPDTNREPVNYRWESPRYEIGLHGGYMRYAHDVSSGIGVLLTPAATGIPAGLFILAEDYQGSWTAGISLTLNRWRWISSEFAYFYQRGKYEYALVTAGTNRALASGFQQDVANMATRQAEYNLLIHARPRESRIRPYVAVGPVLQLLSVTTATLKKPSPAFRLGLSNVGILRSVFDFGSTPPLEGGGVFQLGLQYGGGIKLRVHPRITIQLDVRETLSKDPDFLRKSYTPEYFQITGLDTTYVTVPADGLFRQQRATAGIAFTF